MCPPPPPPRRAVAAFPSFADRAREPPKPCGCTKCVPEGRTCGSGAEASGLCRWCKNNCRKKVHFEDDEGGE